MTKTDVGLSRKLRRIQNFEVYSKKTDTIIYNMEESLKKTLEWMEDIYMDAKEIVIGNRSMSLLCDASMFNCNNTQNYSLYPNDVNSDKSESLKEKHLSPILEHDSPVEMEQPKLIKPKFELKRSNTALNRLKNFFSPKVKLNSNKLVTPQTSKPIISKRTYEEYSKIPSVNKNPVIQPTIKKSDISSSSNFLAVNKISKLNSASNYVAAKLKEKKEELKKKNESRHAANKERRLRKELELQNNFKNKAFQTPISDNRQLPSFLHGKNAVKNSDLLMKKFMPCKDLTTSTPFNANCNTNNNQKITVKNSPLESNTLSPVKAIENIKKDTFILTEGGKSSVEYQMSDYDSKQDDNDYYIETKENVDEKKIPSWAKGEKLMELIKRQITDKNINPDLIFGSIPDFKLTDIFSSTRAKNYTRHSACLWPRK